MREVGTVPSVKYLYALLIVSGRSGDSTNLWRVPFSVTKFTTTGSPQRLTSGGTREDSPSAARLADRKTRIAFSSFTESLSVWSLPIQPNQGKVTGKPEQLTHDAAGDFMPLISRDGNRIVFVSTRPGQQEIWTKDLRTGQETALTAPATRSGILSFHRMALRLRSVRIQAGMFSSCPSSVGHRNWFAAAVVR